MPSRSRRTTRDLIAILGLLALSWTYYGFAFGGRGFVSGDDWYFVATSSLDQLPACTGFQNFHNPWRPFHPTPVCLLYHLTGRSGLGFMSIGFIMLGGLAMLWYAITRRLFRLSSAQALLVALLFLSYPDDNARYTLIGAVRQFGPLCTLLGIWLVLRFWDNPSEKGSLLLGFLSAIVGLLTYESLLFVWAFGLPLALLYRAGGHISRRWILLSSAVVALTVAYLVWVFAILPTTYTDPTLLAGDHTVSLDVGSWLRQFANSYALLFLLWRTPADWMNGAASVVDSSYQQHLVLVGLGAAALTLLLLAAVSRCENIQLAAPQGASLLAAALISVPLFAGTYYFTSISLLDDRFRTTAISFPGSLGLLGVCLLIRSATSRAFVAGIILSASIVWMVAGSGHLVRDWQTQARISCDFFERLTAQVAALPQDVYTVVRDFESSYNTHTLHDTYFMSTALAAIYDEGSYSAASYDYRRMGFNGYFLFVDTRAEIEGDLLQVDWAGEQTALLHSGAPLPDGIPLGQALLIEYAPMRALRLVSIPEGVDGFQLNSAPQQATEPSARVRAFCDWR
jgi:hypothetical protein